MKVNSYVKRPIKVEAMKVDYSGGYLRTSVAEIMRSQLLDFCPQAFLTLAYCDCCVGDLDTVERGKVRIRVGDYLVKGVDDDFYPVKASIFEKTYNEYKGYDGFKVAATEHLEDDGRKLVTFFNGKDVIIAEIMDDKLCTSAYGPDGEVTTEEIDLVAINADASSLSFDGTHFRIVDLTTGNAHFYKPDGTHVGEHLAMGESE